MTFLRRCINKRMACSAAGATLALSTVFCAGAVAAHAQKLPPPGVSTRIVPPMLLKGSTKASYFWDDASGRAGDTGLPAIGKPMQKGLFASPSWPLGTEGFIVYKDKEAPFFIGDRGPGIPSDNGVMLDIDAKTFAELTGGTFNSTTLMVQGFDSGHIEVSYIITKWGEGPGTKNHPVPFSDGAWRRVDNNPAPAPAS
ncbi:hypothetical protein GCM10009677_17760 [Sphaerisporangium rubeum]